MAPAIAAMWVGILSLFNATISEYWDHLLLIALITPALTIITTTAMILYHGWTLPWPADNPAPSGK